MVLSEKPEGMRLLGKPRLKWEDNIKMDFQEVGRGHGLYKTLSSIKYGEFLD
jgi:hypothetical protein